MPKLSPPPFYAPPARINAKTQQSEFAPEWLDYFTKQSNFLGDALNFTSNDGGATLTYTNATTLTLIPSGGGRIPVYIDGSVSLIEVPSGGVAYTASGLGSNTLYYVYARYSGNAIVIDLTTVGHANAGGIEVRSDAINQTLVGMARTNGSGQFADSAIFRGVATWFNKRPRSLRGSFAGDVSVSATSGSPVAMISPDVVFLSWGGPVASYFDANALCEWTAGSSEFGYLEARVNGNLVGTIGAAYLTSAGPFDSAACSACEELAEGAKTFNMYGYTFGGNTVKYRASYTGFAGWVII